MFDARLDVSPEERCVLCQHSLREEHNVMLIESGELLPSKKDDRFWYFRPDRMFDEERATLSLFHAYCVLGLTGRMNWSDTARCIQCGRPLKTYEAVYAFRLGRIDPNTLLFIPAENEKSVAYSCVLCTWDAFGDGDLEEGKALLEATGQVY